MNTTTFTLQVLLLRLVADLHGIAAKQRFCKQRLNEPGLHFTSSCKEQRQQTEEDRAQDRIISWHDDSLLNTCYFLIYCLLTAEVNFKSCLWTQDKQIFSLERLFFSQLLLGSQQFGSDVCVQKKNKDFRHFFFFWFWDLFFGNF